jgi:hypothetical protein
MFEEQTPDAPRTYVDLWTEKFAVTCDIICRLIVMPNILDHSASITGDDIGKSKNLKSLRLVANSKIKGLYRTLNHNNETRWGNKTEIPLVKKTALLGKRKRVDKDGRTAGGDGVFGPGGQPGGAVQD